MTDTPTNFIAGHTFQTNNLGRRVCVACNKPWTLIAGATEADIDRNGIAHVGPLSRREYEEICAERDRIWQHVMAVASPQ